MNMCPRHRSQCRNQGGNGRDPHGRPLCGRRAARRARRVADDLRREHAARLPPARLCGAAHRARHRRRARAGPPRPRAHVQGPARALLREVRLRERGRVELYPRRRRLVSPRVKSTSASSISARFFTCRLCNIESPSTLPKRIPSSLPQAFSSDSSPQRYHPHCGSRT